MQIAIATTSDYEMHTSNHDDHDRLLIIIKIKMATDQASQYLTIAIILKQDILSADSVAMNFQWR